MNNFESVDLSVKAEEEEALLRFENNSNENVMSFSWEGNAVLESSSDQAGPWSIIGEVSLFEINLKEITAENERQFFRLDVSFSASYSNLM